MLMLPAMVLAQRNITPRYLLWGGFQQRIVFNERWELFNDAQARLELTDGDWFNILWRQGIQFKFKNNHTGMIGYARFHLYPNPNNGVFRREWRLWQEWGAKQSFERNIFIQRIRIEQRFIATPETNYKFSTFRARFRVEWQRYLTEQRNTYLIVGNELIIAATRVNFVALDQNRIFAGLGYKINDAWGVSITGMHLLLRRSEIDLESHSIIRFVIQHQLAL
jgi:hypothetical protein